jgi:hypothetical protein
MLASSRNRLALLVLGVGVGVAALSYPTDEKRVREAAEALISAANQGDRQLALALAAHAIEAVRVNVSELGAPLVGRDALVGAAREARQLEQKLHFQIDTVEVHVEGRRARLDADVITTLRPELPELRRPRRSSAIFEKRGDKFQLVSAEIGAERLDQPEARP